MALFGNIYKDEIMRTKFGSKMPISEFIVLVEFICNINKDWGLKKYTKLITIFF
jgi:hypothetical protein